MGIATIDVLLMHCLEWTSHVSVYANLKVPINLHLPHEVNGYLVGLFLEMHCALITAAGADSRVIVSKALCKRIEMLFHNVLCAIQELNIIIIIIYQVLNGYRYRNSVNAVGAEIGSLAEPG